MLKRSTRIGLLGAVLAGVSALGLWACTPAPVAGGNNPNNNPNNNPVVTPASQLGQVKVAIQLPSDSRQAQSVLDALSSVSLSITSANLASPLTATITKADLSDNAETKTFTDVPAGAATVKAVAKNAEGGEMATDTAAITVVAGSTVYTNMKLTLVTNAGVVSATITIEIVDQASNVTIGEKGAKQTSATYVGQDTCIMCHSGIGEAFKTTAHYKGIRDATTGIIRYPAKGRPTCAQCHAAGTNADLWGSAIPYDFTTKAATDSPNDLVSTITCEACHGPGSKHVVATYADRFQTITRRPAASDSCMTCHAGYLKEYGADGKPVLETGSTSYQKYNPANLPATGASEAEFMAGGVHNALGMGPAASALNQTGGYTGGAAVGFQNAHGNLPNGCASCHMANLGHEKHTFAITEEATSSTLTNSCQKCHGSNFTAQSISTYQGQTKMALAKLKDALVAFRQAFSTETVKKTYSGISDKSTDSAKIADFTRAPSLWDDSPDFVKAATESSTASTTIWIDKGNWTGQDPWSNHQKLYNQAYWNYSLANGEGSSGIHAPTYTHYLLQSSYNSLVTELKKPWPGNTEAANASKSFSILSLK